MFSEKNDRLSIMAPAKSQPPTGLNITIGDMAIRLLLSACVGGGGAVAYMSRPGANGDIETRLGRLERAVEAIQQNQGTNADKILQQLDQINKRGAEQSSRRR